MITILLFASGSFIIPNEPVPDHPLKSFQVPLETIENYSGTHFLQYLQRHKVSFEHAHF